jgi:hypothetical protein
MCPGTKRGNQARYRLLNGCTIFSLVESGYGLGPAATFARLQTVKRAILLRLSHSFVWFSNPSRGKPPRVPSVKPPMSAVVFFRLFSLFQFGTCGTGRRRMSLHHFLLNYQVNRLCRPVGCRGGYGTRRLALPRAGLLSLKG